MITTTLPLTDIVELHHNLGDLLSDYVELSCDIKQKQHLHHKQTEHLAIRIAELIENVEDLLVNVTTCRHGIAQIKRRLPTQMIPTKEMDSAED